MYCIYLSTYTTIQEATELVLHLSEYIHNNTESYRTIYKVETLQEISIKEYQDKKESSTAHPLVLSLLS